jgi:hypothetical protein
MLGSAGLWTGAFQSAAAPALKGEPKSGTIDFDRLHELVTRAAQDGKWPATADERNVRDTFRTVFDRAMKAADVEKAAFPVEFDRLEKTHGGLSFEKVRVANTFVIAGDVRGTVATDSVILAAGDVKFTSLSNCVVVGKNVRFTSARNCVVIAAEYLRGTGVDLGKGDAGRSVLVSGKWIRLTSATGAICRVRRPGTDAAPDDLKGIPSTPARFTSATDVVFLNSAAEVQTTTQKDCRHVELKGSLDR